MSILVFVQIIDAAVVSFIVLQVPRQIPFDIAAHLGCGTACCVDVNGHNFPVHLAVVHHGRCAQHLDGLHAAGRAGRARDFLHVDRVRVTNQLRVVVFRECRLPSARDEAVVVRESADEVLAGQVIFVVHHQFVALAFGEHFVFLAGALGVFAHEALLVPYFLRDVVPLALRFFANALQLDRPSFVFGFRPAELSVIVGFICCNVSKFNW